MEWYDFALYGAFATVIAATFFPGADPAGGLLAAFAVFGVAFLLALPLGLVGLDIRLRLAALGRGDLTRCG